MFSTGTQKRRNEAYLKRKELMKTGEISKGHVKYPAVQMVKFNLAIKTTKIKMPAKFSCNKVDAVWKLHHDHKQAAEPSVILMKTIQNTVGGRWVDGCNDRTGLISMNLRLPCIMF